jgi:hypothetical protein
MYHQRAQPAEASQPALLDSKPGVGIRNHPLPCISKPGVLVTQKKLSPAHAHSLRGIRKKGKKNFCWGWLGNASGPHKRKAIPGRFIGISVSTVLLAKRAYAPQVPTVLMSHGRWLSGDGGGSPKRSVSAGRGGLSNGLFRIIEVTYCACMFIVTLQLWF